MPHTKYRHSASFYLAYTLGCNCVCRALNSHCFSRFLVKCQGLTITHTNLTVKSLLTTAPPSRVARLKSGQSEYIGHGKSAINSYASFLQHWDFTFVSHLALKRCFTS